MVRAWAPRTVKDLGGLPASARAVSPATLLGDLGIVQRFERPLVTLVDQRFHRVTCARLDDLLQLTDPDLVEPGIA